MKNIISCLLNLKIRKKHLFSGALLFLFLCLGFYGYGIQAAYAQDALSAIGQGAGSLVSNLATLILKLFSGIIWFVIYWMGDLMDNTFILEGEIGEKLHAVWIIVRNFVNIAFALALVIVAFLSVIGYGDEGGNYAMKKFIPKMALALIAVNFTFLACRLVLDVNNVLTTAIFAIPKSVTSFADIGASSPNQMSFKKFSCLSDTGNITANTTLVEQLNEKYPGVINQLGGICFAVDPRETPGTNPWPELQQLIDNTSNITYNGQSIVSLKQAAFTKKDFTWVLSTQFQGLNNLNLVSRLTGGGFGELTVNALFSILFAIVYGTAYIAMFIILMARLVVLWITIMLSPLAAVSIALPDLLPEDLNIQKKFIDHAFVPVKMAIPIAFGYILISQMSIAVDTGSNIVTDKIFDLTEGGEFARGVSFTSLIYGAASVAVIWMGVFMAGKDVVGGTFVDTWIKDPLERAGQAVARWPTYLSIIPAPGGGVSIAAIQAGVAEAQHEIAEGMDKRARERGMKLFGIQPSAVREAVHQIETALRQDRPLGAGEMASFREIATNGTHEQFTDVLSRAVGTNNRTTIEALARAANVAPEVLSSAVERNSTTELAQIQNNMKAGTTGGGGGATTQLDYGTISKVDVTGGDNNNNIMGLTPAIVTSLTADTRTGLGINAENNGLDINTPEFLAFMTNLRDSTKVNNNLFAEIVGSDQFGRIARTTEIKNQLMLDSAFLGRFAGAETDNTERNKKLWELYKAITGKTDNNYINIALGYKSDGTHIQQS